MNATFGDGVVKEGNLALLSQSGAVCTAILDWAKSQDIGFSTVVSMGGAADIDFGEVLDYLATDTQTTGILMYVEGIRDARRFLSGLKAAARLKPVILIKSGRHEAGVKAAMSHTGAMVGGDNVFDAAIARAGVVRAYSITELFSAARVLANNYVVNEDRLAIITNAGGPGVMSTDRAEDVGIKMAELSEASLTALNAVLPVHWSHANPVDILGDATSERYQQSLEICLKDDNIDGVLVILTPQAMTDPTQVAKCIIEGAKHSKKPVLAAWTGGARVQEGRELFANSHVAHFSTPEVAVDAFGFLANYAQNQILLKQIPSPSDEKVMPDVTGARLIIERVLAEGRDVLTAQEAKAILAAFHIPVNVARHFTEMEQAIKRKYPDIHEVGMTVETMFKSASGRELMIGVVRDPVFGPAISFGLGGTMVEIIKDNAVALPPLNAYMVEQMIAKTKAANYLGAFRDLPPANKKALVDVLLNISDMVSELPEILELDINPLIVDAQGAIAVDARIKAQSSHQLSRYAHMAIHPYPHELTQHYSTPSGINVTETDFVSRLSEQTKYFRYHRALQELTPEMLVRFTQIDYDREMAFVAVSDDPTLPSELGVGRYSVNPDGHSVEFSLVVADDSQHLGIGSKLMRTLMQSAKEKGMLFFEAEVLSSNEAALAMLDKLGQLAQENDFQSTRLLKILHAIQKRYFYIPTNAIEMLAEQLHIPRTHIQSVVAFYSFFHTQPSGKYTI